MKADSTPPPFGPSEVEALRTRLGWTRTELARCLAVPPSLVVDWELGERFPTRRHARMLAELVREPLPPQPSTAAER